MKKNVDTNNKHRISTADASGGSETQMPPMTMNNAETTASTTTLDPTTADEEHYLQDEIWQMRFQPTEARLRTLRTLHHDYWRKMDCHMRFMMQFVGKSDDIWKSAENEIKELEKSYHAARDLFYDTMSQYSDEWFDQLSPEEQEKWQAGLAVEDGDIEFVTEVIEDKNREIEKQSRLRKHAEQRANDTRQLFREELAETQNGVDYLVHKSKERTESNAKRGKENQAKGNTEEQKRAAADMGTALKRVHDDPDVKAGKHGALLAACRRVCREFKPLTNKKNEMGKCEQYAPLTKAGGEKVKPETLATNYRKKYGARQPRKVSRRAK